MLLKRSPKAQAFNQTTTLFDNKAHDYLSSGLDDTSSFYQLSERTHKREVKKTKGKNPMGYSRDKLSSNDG